MDSRSLLAGQEPEKKTFGNTVAVLMVVVAGLGPLTFGYTLGFTSPSTLPMEVGRGPWLYEAVFDKSSLSWKAGSSSIDSSESSLFGSLVNVGCMIGAMIAGPLADFAGRKVAIASAAVPWLGAWLLVGFGSSFGPILAGRVLSGIATGVASMTVPLYIAETAPASLRGALGAVNQLGVTLGIFTVYLLGDVLQSKRQTVFGCAPLTNSSCPESMACEAGVCTSTLAPWRLLAFIGGGLSCALFVCALLVLPETPSMYVRRGKHAAAKKVLLRLRSSAAEALKELDELIAQSGGKNRAQVGDTTTQGRSTCDSEQMVGVASDVPAANISPLDAVPKVTGLRGLCAVGVRWPLAIGCILMVVQQCSGINAVIFYSSDILRTAGIDDPNLGGLIVMAVQVVMTLVSVLLMDRAGRRVLLLISLSGMTICCGGLAAFHLNHEKPSWLALAALIGYIVAFSLGLGAIPWLLMGEIIPSHVRALGSSVATMANWTLSFIVTETFATLRTALGPAGTFFLFGGVCACGAIFVALCVPETKGKSLQEIEALF